MEEKPNNPNSRLDLEVYIMGEMKYEFISFLGECYKENFCETLSWGNFRRFQLTLIGKQNWINIYFILLKNEMTAHVLINTFKKYEKRNSTLILYNFHDQKTKKAAEMLQEALIFERNKFYEGILNDNSIKKNLKKLSEDITELKADVDINTLKKNLKYLVDNEHTLIHKIGISSNQTNKKTKNVKKNDSSCAYYEIDSPIFYLEESEKSVFNEIVNFIITDHFSKLSVEEKEYEQFLKVIVDYSKLKSLGETPSVKKQKAGSSLLNYVFKSIDWLILFYILICFYNFLIN
jgi:hypothetical protein